MRGGGKGLSLPCPRRAAQRGRGPGGQFSKPNVTRGLSAAPAATSPSLLRATRDSGSRRLLGCSSLGRPGQTSQTLVLAAGWHGPCRVTCLTPPVPRFHGRCPPAVGARTRGGPHAEGGRGSRTAGPSPGPWEETPSPGSSAEPSHQTVPWGLGQTLLLYPPRLLLSLPAVQTPLVP